MKYFFGESISLFWEKSSTKKILGIIAFFTITIIILFSKFSPQHVMLRVDEVAKRDIVSNVQAQIVDENRTEELRKQAAAEVQKSYQEDKSALPNARNKVINFYAALKEIKAAENPEAKSQIKELLNNTWKEEGQKLKPDFGQLSNYLVNARSSDLEQMEKATLSLIEKVMDKPITIEALPAAYEESNWQVANLGFSPEAEDIIEIITTRAISPNMVYNREATEKAIKEARDKVPPVQKTVKVGEVIVREGERVTAEQILILEQLGIQRPQSYPVTILGTAGFIFITFWLAIEFLRRYHREIYNNDALMLLVGLVIIIVLLVTRLLTIIEIPGRPEVNALTGYLAPVAAGSMLITILLDSRLAYFITMIMALYIGLLTSGSQLSFVIVAFVGGTVGIYRVSRLSQTSDLAKSGLYIAGVNIATIVVLSLIGGNTTTTMMVTGILLGAISGILSAILMIGVLPYLETGFSITSMIKLLELSNPNHPLLKRLLIEAPGTYHHSLMVGNLAEASAESIGANPLLVRVGAYYHDIGKIKRPEYFVENQRGSTNPHEKIAPALSALIITSHVREGVELAREARLPQVIIDFIAEHHGTSLAKYFYSLALEEGGEGQVNEESFRYEGPKPQSKEVALVMLADSVEAAVRSLNDPSLERIREMVRKIIRDRLNDRQLEECSLTFKDLDVVASVFTRVLEGVYHKRIEYPDTLVRDLTKRREYYEYDDNKPTEPS